MSGPTPGPWSVRVKQKWEKGDGGSFAIDADGWGEMATVYGHCSDTSSATGEANACLIAAAPELLDVLKYVRERMVSSEIWWIDDPRSGGFDAARIDAVIAKATTP